MMERRQGDALEQGNMLFRDLERRLDEVADRLDQRVAPQRFDSAGIMDAIDARFTALAHGWKRARPMPPAQRRSADWKAGSKTFPAGSTLPAAQVAGIDPDLIRSLEAQVAGLSAHLSTPSTPLPEFEDIGPRLDEIEKLACRHAAISDPRRGTRGGRERGAFAGRSSANTTAVSGLAEDLKTLETLTRRSDERNSRTFEAIHDTLLKIVDRLGSLETSDGPSEASSARAERRKLRSRSARWLRAPSLDFDEPVPLTEDIAVSDAMAAP